MATPEARSPPAPSPPLDDAGCADCHPAEVEAFRATPMGRSLGPVRPDGLPPTPATIAHAPSGLTYTARLADGGLVFEERTEGHRETRPAQLTIGSGAHTLSFLWRRGAAYFQHPLTWYASGRWDLSPGYHVPDQPGFFRPIDIGCLVCHADPPDTVDGQPDRFVGEPRPIGCGRCHGGLSEHVAGRLAGQATRALSPRDLPPDRRADVCDQCHLPGAIRFPMPGRSPRDFVPGQRLAEVMAVFLRQTPDEGVGIANHGERLRLSRCRDAADAPLTCTRCHSPHPTSAPSRSVVEVCRDCHAPGELDPGAHSTDTLDRCADCHLVRTATRDVPHVRVTDHRIRRNAGSFATPVPGDAPLLRLGGPEPDPTRPVQPDEQRLLGRAYAEATRIHGQKADRERAVALLRAGLAANPDDPEALYDLAAMETLGGDPAQAIRTQGLLASAAARAPRSAPLARAAAESALAAGRPSEARATLEGVLAARPDDAELLALSALADALAGRRQEAARTVERALALQPRLGAAWGVRGLLAETPDAAEAAYRAATRLDPAYGPGWLSLADHLARQGDAVGALEASRGATGRARTPSARAKALSMSARALLDLGRVPEAEAHIGEAAGLAPPDPVALGALGRLALHRRQRQDALTLLSAALAANPGDPTLTAALEAAHALPESPP